MKKARKLTAVLLSLVMLLALVVPASAAENYSITIHNDKTGHTYEAYQIFAGTVSSDAATDGEAEGPMLGDITWGSGVNDARYAELLAALKADATIGALGGMQDAADAAAVAAALDGADAETAAAFADVVSDYLAAAPTGQTNNMADGNYIIQGLPAGYYLVKDKDDTLDGTADTATDYIVQVLGNVTMDPKDSDIPTVLKKVYDEEFAQGDQTHTYGLGYNDVADWDIGDNVPFKLIASVPDAAEIEAYDTYTYTFHDTLDAGLTLLQKDDADQTTFEIYFVNDLTIDPRDEGFQYLDAREYNANINAGTNSFTITIDDLKTLQITTAEGDQYPATNYDYIVIFYDAVLNENAEIGLPGNENTAYLEFSNNPTGEGTGRTEEDTVIVFTYELDGTKVDGADVDTKLADAQFVLLNGAKSEAAVVVDGKVTEWIKFGTQADGTKLEIPTTYEGWTTLAQQYNGLILTSDENGLFNIAGLDDGTYYLREIQAPAGYNLLENDVELVITADTANGQEWDGDPATALEGLNMTFNVVDAEEVPTEVEGVLVGGTVGITVENNRGATLPETGGMGTTLFYIIGGLLVVGAGILLVVRIRMKAHNE